MVATIGGLGYYNPQLNGFVEDNIPDANSIAGWMDVVTGKSNGYQRDMIDALMHDFAESDDYGSTWSTLSASLPSSPAMGKNVLRINENNSEMRSYVYNTEKATWEFSSYGGGGIGIVDYIPFNINPSSVPTGEGYLSWNNTNHVLEFQTDTEAIMQIGLELWDRGYNDSGSTITNGSVVYPMGISNGLGNARLAKADSHDTAKHPLAIATVDILNNDSGQVTVFGDVNGIDTSHLSLGPVYLSATTAGAITSTPPTHPDIRYLLGFCKVVDAVNGVIFVIPRDHDNLSYFNGTFREQIDFLISSDGVNVTGTLERTGGGNLSMFFSDGFTTLDCTPALEIDLTSYVGTNSSPQSVYVYIPYSTKTLTASTSGWATEQHIRVAFLLLHSITGIQNDGGAYINQNWNDADANVTTGQGHMSHMAMRIRKEGAKYEDGIDANGATSSYFTLGVGTSYFVSTAGSGWQMHEQTIQAKSMPTDDAHVVNWSGDAYHEISNLFDIVNDSTGTTIGNNKYFNLVFWIVVNKGGEYSPLMINLPSGSYTNLSSAQQDVLGYDVLTIPEEFKKDSSTGILVCRATFQMKSTWTHESTVDLRGTTATSVVGGGGTGVTLTSFSDGDFSLYDNADITKQLTMELSGITTANIRTWTVQDSSGTVPLLEATQTFTGVNTFTQDIKIVKDSPILHLLGDGGNDDFSGIVMSESGTIWGTNLYGARIAFDGSTNTLKFQTAELTTVVDAFSIDRTSGETTFAKDITLSTGVDIQSADEDLSFTFGRVAIHSITDNAYFGHRDHASTSSYAIRQLSTGATYINSATGQTTFFRINNSNVMTQTSTAITSVVNHDFSAGIDVTGNATVDGHFAIGKNSVARSWHTSFDGFEISDYQGIMSNKTSDGLYLMSNAYYTASGWTQGLSSQETLILTLDSGNMTLRHGAAGMAVGAVTERFTFDGSTGDLAITGDFSFKGDTTTSLGYLGTTGIWHLYQNASSQAYLTFQNSTTGSTTGDGFTVGLTSAEEAIIWNRENSILKFGTNGTERMTIAAAGNVGINATTPSYKLDVGGTFRATGSCTISRIIGYSSSTASGSTIVRSSADGGLYVTSSTIRNKVIGDDLIIDGSILYDMIPRQWIWKDSNIWSYGFIAEELQALDERLVLYDNDGLAEDFDNRRLMATMVVTIQELKAEKDAEIDLFQKENIKLTEKVNNLKQEILNIKEILKLK